MAEKNVCSICGEKLEIRAVTTGPVGWGRKTYTKKESFCPKCKITTHREKKNGRNYF